MIENSRVRIVLKGLLAFLDAVYLILAGQFLWFNPNWKFYLALGGGLAVVNFLLTQKLGLKWSNRSRSAVGELWEQFESSAVAMTVFLIGFFILSMPWYVAFLVIIVLAIYLYRIM
jgi:hypothetical protein